MKKLTFVVGANFGDEGKGLMVDYFCSQTPSSDNKILVIMPNGGSQRGHTVSVKGYARHVFHHISSGTFANADTFLPSSFILNPMIYVDEVNELNRNYPYTSPYRSKLFASPGCMVTTPFDMMFNQALEIVRGKKKHGSCGVGIYQTLRRYRDTYFFRGKDYRLSYGDLINLLHIGDLASYLKVVKEYYEEEMASQIGASLCEMFPCWNEDGIIDHFIDDFRFMSTHIHPIFGGYHGERCIIKKYDEIVVELGQGLLLSQDNMEYYPHLTPSYTGLKCNFSSLRDIINIDEYDIEACYVTRTYLTRHGNGRLDGECLKEELSDKIEDFTNCPNPHQGRLRFAPLDVNELVDRINNDFLYAPKGTKKSLAVTHNDQLSLSSAGLEDIFEKFDTVYVSDGDTRECVMCLELDKKK